MNQSIKPINSFISHNFSLGWQTGVDKSNLSYERNPDITYIKESFSTHSATESPYLTNTLAIFPNEVFRDKLEREFKYKFIDFITHENVNEDYESIMEQELSKFFKENAYVTGSWFSGLMVEYISESKPLINLLKILSKSDFNTLFREHLTILGLLLNKDIEVKDFAIRVFESWADHQSLKILQASDPIVPDWLENYKQQVIKDIQELTVC